MGSAYGHVDANVGGELATPSFDLASHDLLKCAVEIGDPATIIPGGANAWNTLKSRSKQVGVNLDPVHPGAGLIGAINSHSIPMGWAAELISTYGFEEYFFWHYPITTVNAANRVEFVAGNPPIQFGYWEVRPIPEAWFRIWDFIFTKYPRWFDPAAAHPNNVGIFIDDSWRVHTKFRLVDGTASGAYGGAYPPPLAGGLLYRLGINNVSLAGSMRRYIQKSFEFCLAAQVWYIRQQKGDDILILNNGAGVSPSHRAHFESVDAPGKYIADETITNATLATSVLRWMNGVTIEIPECNEDTQYYYQVAQEVTTNSTGKNKGCWSVNWFGALDSQGQPVQGWEIPGVVLRGIHETFP